MPLKPPLKHHYLNGQWQPGVGEEFTSLNPATGERLWSACIATKEEIQQAYESACRAQVGWSAHSVEERYRYLEAFTWQVQKKRDHLAYCIACENGKPLWEAYTEVDAVINKLSLTQKAHQQRQQKILAPATAAGQAYVRYKPQGVVAVLGAFNFPAHLSNGHIMPALLAGNTVLYKPSELTPWVAAEIMQCWHAAGLPQGVLQCLWGDHTSGQYLLNHPLNGVYFTGSYPTGKAIHAHFGGRPEVILALEMGGNNPLIVDNVHNLPAAVTLTVLSTVLSTGQRCTCARRVFIPKTRQGDDFINQLLYAYQHVRIGAHTHRPEPFMGPLIRASHAQKALQNQEKLLACGGKALLPMALLPEGNTFLSPGILDMTHAHGVPDEEYFAPFIQVIRYEDFNEALEGANQTQYGLTAGLISDDPVQYSLFYQRMRAGMLYWNAPLTGASGTLPFGGSGHSGNHRPSGFFAIDYCAYPVSGLEQAHLRLPATLPPGFTENTP